MIHSEFPINSRASLAEDSKILKCMEALSDRVVSQNDVMFSSCKQLYDEIRQINASVDDLINDFAHLSSQQFIENKVSDDCYIRRSEHTKSKCVEQLSKTEQDVALLKDIQSCGTHSLGFLTNHFVKVQPRPADFDESDDPTFMPEPTFIPKGRFLQRPLPHIIGSDAFLKSRFAGLLPDGIQKDHADERTVSHCVESLQVPCPKGQVSDTVAEQIHNGSFSMSTPDTSLGSIINGGIANQTKPSSKFVTNDEDALSFQASLQSKLATLNQALSNASKASKSDIFYDTDDENRALTSDNRVVSESVSSQHGRITSQGLNQAAQVEPNESCRFMETPPPVPLFDDDSDDNEDDIFFPKSKPAFSKPSYDKTTATEKISPNFYVSSGSSTKDLLTEQINIPHSSPSQVPKQNTLLPSGVKSRIKSLFNDDDDDENEDLFSTPPSNNSKTIERAIDNMPLSIPEAKAILEVEPSTFASEVDIIVQPKSFIGDIDDQIPVTDPFVSSHRKPSEQNFSSKLVSVKDLYTTTNDDDIFDTPSEVSKKELIAPREIVMSSAQKSLADALKAGLFKQINTQATVTLETSKNISIVHDSQVQVRDSLDHILPCIQKNRATVPFTKRRPKNLLRTKPIDVSTDEPLHCNQNLIAEDNTLNNSHNFMNNLCTPISVAEAVKVDKSFVGDQSGKMPNLEEPCNIVEHQIKPSRISLKKTIFDDDDDDIDDIFSSSAVEHAKTTVFSPINSAAPVSHISSSIGLSKSLFDDEVQKEDDLFTHNNPTRHFDSKRLVSIDKTVSEVVPQEKIAPILKSNKKLFDDSDDSDLDLFK